MRYLLTPVLENGFSLLKRDFLSDLKIFPKPLATAPKGEERSSKMEEKILERANPVFKNWRLLVLLMFFFCVACHHRAAYSPPNSSVHVHASSPYRLTLFADARGLDYSSARSLYCSLLKQGHRRYIDGIFGHAWVRVEGVREGELFVLEGGHTGETGCHQPKYWDGVMDYVQWGYLNPNTKQKKHPRLEPNPIKYLWTTQQDGYFQEGSGGHRPTHRAEIPLTQEMFEAILTFIQDGQYPFREYQITNKQCASFVADVAAIAGVTLQHRVNIPVQRQLRIGRIKIPLWSDPIYSSIMVSTPDKLVQNPQFVPILKTQNAERRLQN